MTTIGDYTFEYNSTEWAKQYEGTGVEVLGSKDSLMTVHGVSEQDARAVLKDIAGQIGKLVRFTPDAGQQ